MNSKFTSRILASLCMAAVLLSACGSGGSAQSGAPNPAGSSGDITGTDSQGAAPEIPDYLNEPGVFPICKELTQVSIAVIQDPNIEDYETNYETGFLEEKANMEFTFNSIPSSDVAQKVQLAMASFELPDAYFGVGRTGTGAQVFNTTNILKYGEEDGDGQVISLNSLIETYGDNLLKVFEKYDADGLRQMMTSANGQIYYVPCLGPSKINRSSAVIWMNQNWLDSLHLEMPTTTDELYDVLTAFRDNDPNGNGVKDEIPAAGTTDSPSYSFYDAVMAAFTVNNTQNSRLYYDGSRKVHFAANEDAWREGLQYLHKLGTEGLVSPLTFTQDVSGLKQVATDGNDILGCFTSLGLDLITAAAGDDISQRYHFCPPLKGPNGTQLSVLTIPTPTAGGVITSACKVPEAMFRLMDYMVGEECSTLSRYGVEGENYIKAPDGVKDLYGNQATIMITKNCWQVPQNNMWMNLLPFINDIHNDGAGYETVTWGKKMNGDSSVVYMEYEPTNQIPISVYTLEEAEVVNDIKINIDNFVKEAAAKFITGEWDPNDDAAWKKYLGELDAMGLPDFLEAAQAAYDRSLEG